MFSVACMSSFWFSHAIMSVTHVSGREISRPTHARFKSFEVHEVVHDALVRLFNFVQFVFVSEAREKTVVSAMSTQVCAFSPGESVHNPGCVDMDQRIARAGHQLSKSRLWPVHREHLHWPIQLRVVQPNSSRPETVGNISAAWPRSYSLNPPAHAGRGDPTCWCAS